MGAFVSKLSEAAKVQSGNEVEESKRDGASKRIDGGGDVVTVETDSRGGAPPLPLVIAGVAYLMLGVAARYASYVLVQRLLERSEKKIKELEAMIQGEGAQDLYLVVKLKRWKKKRDEAEAYLKRHKLMGKLVKTFSPDTDTHID